jgi:3-dehydroquinate synthase
MTKHKHHTEPLNLNWRSSIGVETGVTIGHGTLNKLPDLLSQLHVGNKVLLLKQPDLFIQEIDKIKNSLHLQGMSVHILEIPAGESSKSVDCLLKIWDILHETNFSRNDTLIAIGGGAVSDVAGFAASTYKRGINLVTIPTTLLAQVDAAIGGKTAVNFNNTKNMAGTFYFAKAIIVDISTLATLPADQFISGWAEVIKYALLEKTIAEESEYSLGPKPLLTVLEEMAEDLRWDNILLPGIIAACIKMKLAVVAKDPLESGLRRSLNLGHTLGHALEAASNFQLSHGQAVAIGMAFAFRLAVSRSQISKSDEQKALLLMEKSGLPIQIPTEIKPQTLPEAILHDKKRDGEGIKMVLPMSCLGQVDYRSFIKRQEIEDMLSAFCY